MIEPLTYRGIEVVIPPKKKLRVNFVITMRYCIKHVYELKIFSRLLKQYRAIATR
ncbi:MAG: hypothetical protein F6K35_00375 [Okeania sp. SIO2H7]|nr:hypothetical protein [Okeania sp. SIO2H7]